jgi:hypothetical protein
MNVHLNRLCLVVAVGLSGIPAWSAVLLDEDWDDGERTETNLPEESAWFASNAGATPSLTALPGALLGTVRLFETNAGSRLWITHFTPAGAPAELAVGDTLRISTTFTVSNVTMAPGTGRGLRIGLFNFSEPGAARVTGDGFSTGAGGGAPGVNVTGYAVSVNFAQTLTTTPLQITKRTDLGSNNLMGASAVFTTLTTGGGNAGTPGFAQEVPYTFEFIVTRQGETAEITTRFSDDRGWSISHTATDTLSPNFRFDGLAFRPNGALDTADTFTFMRCKAELVPFTMRILATDFVFGGLRITWSTLPGRSYRLESRFNFDDAADWNPIGTVTADATMTSLTDLDAFFDPQKFYRVVELP